MTVGYVQESSLLVGVDGDRDAPGGAVTLALCGSWQHDGPCPLAPHHNELIEADGRQLLRTVFVCLPADEALVRHRIEAALAAGRLPGSATGWTLLRCERAEPTDDEVRLAIRLDSS